MRREARVGGRCGHVPAAAGPWARPGPARLGFHSFSVFHPSENYSAEDKYKIWMRHRYNDCVGCLAELMGHGAFRVKVGPEPAAEAGPRRGQLGAVLSGVSAL